MREVFKGNYGNDPEGICVCLCICMCDCLGAEAQFLLDGPGQADAYALGFFESMCY